MEADERIWREHGLRQAILAGNETAWRRWYEENYAGLYAYVLWRCGGLREHADEIVQEVWLTAVRRLATFDPASGSFAGWLRGIAANLVRNHFRRHQHHERMAFRDPWDEPADAEAQRREQAEQIARALSELPPHYEAVLRARYLDGMSVAGIALARGDSLKAVESLLSRARAAFRTAFAAEER